MKMTTTVATEAAGAGVAAPVGEVASLANAEVNRNAKQVRLPCSMTV
jgi:hypothetical protein